MSASLKLPFVTDGQLEPSIEIGMVKFSSTPSINYISQELDSLCHNLLFSPPLKVFDPAGIQRSAFKPCFAILVLCFFLQQLTEDRSFSCDFAYPIDQQLADFLQSRASIAALSRHGSLKESRAPGYSEETSREEGEFHLDGMGDSGRVEVSRKAFTRLSQNSMDVVSSIESDERGLATSMDRHHSSTSEEKAERSVNGRQGSAPVEWRTAGMKAKGELLLANLRFENDSLRRQMEASVQERHFLMTRYEQVRKVSSFCVIRLCAATFFLSPS